MELANILIHPQLKKIIDNTAMPMGVKDLNSRHLYGNSAFARLVGLTYGEELEGRTDFDMPCKTSELAAEFKKQDEEVIKTRTGSRCLDIHPFSSGWAAFIFEKFPLVGDNNDVIGTVYTGFDFANQKAIMQASKILARTQRSDKKGLHGQISYDIAGPSSSSYRAPVSLTARQSEVLFLMLRGKTSKSISEVLGLSKSTIDSHIEQLKYIFDAKGKEELLDNALALGFGSFIPESLFDNQLSVVLKG